MAPERYDLIIVGMGSGGVIAAEFAAKLGVRVCAVERDRIGGDCLWTGCVPSKALLAAGHAAHAMRTADRFGLPAVDPEIDTAPVFERIRAVQAQIGATDDSPERFRAMGVEVRLGAPGVLEGPNAVRVGDEVLPTRHVLLCPGSSPGVPPIEGLEEAGFLTSESLWEVERAPASLVLIGGGPIAVEIAQALTRLGSRVTVIERDDRLLARDEPVLADRLVARLRAEGIQIELGATIERVEVEPDGTRVVHADGRAFRAEAIFVGAGRTPNLSGLGLETIGVDPAAGGPLEVDGRSRTRERSVYAIGDVTGGYQFTHAAAADAAAAVRDMFFPGRGTAGGVVPWCTFTDPELAHAGPTSAEARERYDPEDVEVHTAELAHSDRARAEGQTEGALVAVTHKGRLVGAHALAPAAGELINELALAIDQGLKLPELAAVTHVYPTYGTSIAQLGAEAAYARAERLKWLVRA